LRAGDRRLPVDRWLSIDAEILIPAAMSYVLADANVDEVRAPLVVEAANVPTVETAQRRLHGRGVMVVPDFVANVATNAWWWWTLFGDTEPAADAAFAKIASTLGSLVTQVLGTAARDRVRPRTVALAMSAARSAEVSSRHA